jgi:hypothetical protein
MLSLIIILSFLSGSLYSSANLANRKTDLSNLGTSIDLSCGRYTREP